jgi:signal transduction histidine kinase
VTVRYVAYVAHELRTGLAAQRALLEVALADPDADVAGWRETAEAVLRACRDQERLLEACLSLARSRNGLRRSEPADLAALAARALLACDSGDVEAVAELAPAWATGDPELLERLVANLVSNAIEHNVPGGRIEVATRSDRGRAVLSVANTGPSVSLAELPRLFRPFQRLESSPRAAPGLGLGLAVVQAVASAHRARVTARPRAAGGLEVDVAFPAAGSPLRAT